MNSNTRTVLRPRPGRAKWWFAGWPLAILLLYSVSTLAQPGGDRPLRGCVTSPAAQRVLTVQLGTEVYGERVAAAICQWFEYEPWRIEFVPRPMSPEGDAEPLSDPSSANGAASSPQPGGVLTVVRDTDRRVRMRYALRGHPVLPHADHWIALTFPLDALAIEQLAQAASSVVPLQDARCLRAVEVQKRAAQQRARLQPVAKRRTEEAVESLPYSLSFGGRVVERGAEPATLGWFGQWEWPWEGAWAHGALVLTAGGWQAPSHVVREALRVDLGGTAVAMGWALRRQMRWGDLRGVLQWTSERAVARVQQLQPEGPLRALPRAVSWRGYAEAQLGVALPLQAWRLHLQGLVRAQLNRSAYVAQTSGEPEQLLTSRRVQFGAQVQFGYAWGQ